jgi:hypothetical protein
MRHGVWRAACSMQHTLPIAIANGPCTMGDGPWAMGLGWVLKPGQLAVSSWQLEHGTCCLLLCAVRLAGRLLFRFRGVV